MISLPIDSFLPTILDQLRDAGRAVLVAEPGAGKTTRVPPAILKRQLLSSENPNLIMLQPRRVAARASAARIAEENNWQLGREVGYQVRFERQMIEATRLRVVTEGILIRQLIDDPFLTGVGCVVLDEFHERSIHSDLSLALLRELRASGRDDLKLLVMSATLDAEPVAAFLGGCPIIRVPGRTFPVEIEYAAVPASTALEQRVAQAVVRMLQHDGDVLVFLPGVREIEASQRLLAPIAAQHDLLVLPLFGSLSLEQQQAALRPSARRKVILATNIAETSLTIEGVRIVIDSGLARVASFDPSRGLDRLDLQRISKASAVQRAGRAGRTAPGRCVRLMTEKEFHALADYDTPEIHRIDLAGTVLQLHGWGETNLAKFQWFDPPTANAITASERLLNLLGAVDDGRATALGKAMLRFPMHPRLARLMIAGIDSGETEAAAGMAALLSEREGADLRLPSAPAAASDVVARLPLLLNLPLLRRVRDQFLRVADRRSSHPAANYMRNRLAGEQSWLRMLLQAYPDRVCRRRPNDPTLALMVGGTGVTLAHDSVVKRAEYFLALDARQIERAGRTESLVTVASSIEPDWLEELWPESIRRASELRFDAEQKKVVGVSTVSYHDLVMREARDIKIDSSAAGEVLFNALAASAEDFLAEDEAAQALTARIELLQAVMPEQRWPAHDALALLRERCRNKKSVEEVKRQSAEAFIAAQLVYPMDRLLDQHAPRTLKVPSGSQISLEYARGQAPVLKVRLQELFGLQDTPRIAGGRVPVVIHLLGPNYRPVQITDDLRSFWSSAYFQVRKDLRVRYPKHSWPDDPLTAPPQAKGTRRPR